MEVSSGSGSISQDAITWKTTYFENVTLSATNSVAELWFDPSSVLPIPAPSVMSNTVCQVDHVHIKTLPTYVTPSGQLDALSAYGAIAMAILETVSEDSDGSALYPMGSQSTRVTTKTDPTWVSIFDFNYLKARHDGYVPVIGVGTTGAEMLLAKLEFIHLNTGNAVQAHAFPIQITISGRTMLAPESIIQQSITYGSGWNSFGVIPPTLADHVAVTSLKSLVKDLS
jgi:hypothetical protein